MATASTNLSLIIPEATDATVVRTVYNTNWELIDDIFNTVTLTEFGYLDGVTSAIQTQLNAKQTLDAGLTSITALTYASASFIKLTAEDTYAVSTITETKTDLSLNLVENTALSTWAGSTNITTLGTIATGVWSGTVIGAAKGGTGVANNAASTLTISGNFATTLTVTEATGVTLPASGTLAVNNQTMYIGTTGVAINRGSAALTLAGITLTTPVLGAASATSINLTGGQITFPADQAPSANANTLDDYKEDTWTMGVSFGGGTTGITYSANTGYYTKIGNLVTISGKLILTSKGTSTGAALITGLPFTTVNNIAGQSAVSLYFITVSFANQYIGRTVENTTTILLAEITEAGGVTTLDDTNFANNSVITVGCTYRIE